jgi:beta-lactamase class A
MKKVFVVVTLLVAVIAGVVVVQSRRQDVVVDTNAGDQLATEVVPTATQEETPELFSAEALQQTLTAWSTQQTGDVGVVITDASGEVLAEVSPDEPFFAASIYKLYVAYEGYLQVDRGEVDRDEIYSVGRNRWQCLDVMIRESDSPCAEKWWVELGKEELNVRLASYGLTGTNMVAITTTAADAARMLARITSAGELSEESRAALLESMRIQIYTDTFDSAFAEQTVYNKIGFRELDEYHDVAIIEFSDGRQLIVSALTSRVGTRSIRDLGTAILSAVEQ